MIAMGFGKSSLHAPRLAIELSQLAVGIAVVAGCMLCLTPIKILKSKAISTKLYKYLTVSLIAQPILAIPLIHHFF